MSEMPALDTLKEMADEFEGKSEEEILDVIAERTKKMVVSEYNDLPVHSGSFTKVGQLAKTKPDEKKEGDFVMVLECTTIDMDDETPSMELAARMFLLVA